MSHPPHNPYPGQPQSGPPYGSYPPPQQPGSYPPPPQQPGGYPPHQQQPGGYPPHQQQPGGYPPPQQSGGYPPPQQSGGYPPPQQSGGYPPQQPAGSYQPQPGSYQPPQAGGYPQPGAGPGQPYGDPAGPPPAKKSRVGRILLISLAVVLVLCLGGAAVAFFALRDEVKETVDATKTRVVAPATLAGRPKVSDPNLLDAAKQLESGLKKSMPDATSTVGAFYGTPAERDLVMVAAASGLNTDPDRTLDEAVKGAAESDVQLGEMKTVDAGPLGGEAKCGDAKAAEVPLGVCLWSDKGSLGMIIIYFKSGAETQAEFATIRGQIEQRS
ncbi:hypothetical protein NCC78_26550 [Micromonospora phytophila]|uniref:hypothetical protein n=1 Tax=Micromonospora phytophila TaxID=709888 RepID=UPI0020300EE5|nr:hypothetical protein [Micromonospora phytophila]MCM0678209.1 hypothetical protein [Micromonospora phytophila]